MKSLRLATKIVKILTDEGHTAYFAGGWVRDYLLGHPSADIDIATSALPEEIIKIFPRTIPVGVSFGVVVVLMEGHPFEVATFRKDLEYLDGRKPSSIEISTPQEDAIRRDFTINGMFFDPLKEEVIDFVEGEKDLKAGIIRAIGDPDIRFMEDRLRLIRGIRIAARFKFTIEPATEAAIRRHSHTLFPPVAMERVWQEFKKMGEGSDLQHALNMLHQFGLLQEVFPQLKNENIEQLTSSFPKFPKECPTILYLMELFPDASLKEKIAICDYLKASNKEKDLVTLLCKAKQLSDDVEWVFFYADERSDLCLEVLAAQKPENFLSEHAQRKFRLKKAIQRVIDKTPLVRAAHLQEEGIPPGKIMGKLLQEAERLSIEKDLNDSEAVIELLKQSPSWP